MGAFNQENKGDKAKTREQMKQFLKNVEVFDTGGRGATTSFIERELGDVLISFESEVNNIRSQYGESDYEVIVPPVDILAEFPVAWVDKNVQKNGTEDVAKAYLNYLYSPQAQEIITQYNYRVNDKAVMNANKDKFPETQLFTVESQFESWPKVMDVHFVTGGEFDKLMAEGRR